MRGVGPPQRHDGGPYRSPGASLPDGHTDSSYFNANPLGCRENNIIGIIQHIALQLYGADEWFSQSEILDLSRIINQSNGHMLGKVLQDIAENRSLVQQVRVLENNIANITISFKGGMFGPIGVNHAQIITNYLISGQYYELADFLLSDVFSEPVLNTPSYIQSRTSVPLEVVVRSRTINSRNVPTNDETESSLNTEAQNQSNRTPISPGTEQNITRPLELGVELTDEPSRAPAEEQKQSNSKEKPTYKKVLVQNLSKKDERQPILKGAPQRVAKEEYPVTKAPSTRESTRQKLNQAKKVKKSTTNTRQHENKLKLFKKETNRRKIIANLWAKKFSDIKENLVKSYNSVIDNIRRKDIAKQHATQLYKAREIMLKHERQIGFLATEEMEDRKIVNDTAKQSIKTLREQAYKDRVVITNKNQSDKLKSEETALRCEIESEFQGVINELHSEYTKATRRRFLPLYINLTTLPKIVKAIEDVENKSAKLAEVSKIVLLMVENDRTLPDQLVITAMKNNEYVKQLCERMLKFIDEFYKIPTPTDYKLVECTFLYADAIYKLRIIVDYYVYFDKQDQARQIIKMARAFVDFANGSLNLSMLAILEYNESKRICDKFCDMIVSNCDSQILFRNIANQWANYGKSLKEFKPYTSAPPPHIANKPDYEKLRTILILKIDGYLKSLVQNDRETNLDDMIESLNRFMRDHIKELEEIIQADNPIIDLKDVLSDVENIGNLYDGLTNPVSGKVKKLDDYKASVKKPKIEYMSKLSDEICRDLSWIGAILHKFSLYYEDAARAMANFAAILPKLNELFSLKFSKLSNLKVEETKTSLTIIFKLCHKISLAAENEHACATICQELLLTKIDLKILNTMRIRFLTELQGWRQF